MARAALISSSQQEDVLNEFSEVALAASTGVLRGRRGHARRPSKRALGSFKASDVLGRVAPTRASDGAMHAIAEMDRVTSSTCFATSNLRPSPLSSAIWPPEKAAQLLALLRPEQRDPIVERLATLAPTPVEVAEKSSRCSMPNSAVKQTRALAQTGGVTTAADVAPTAVDIRLSAASLLSGIGGSATPSSRWPSARRCSPSKTCCNWNRRPSSASCGKSTCATLPLALKKASEPLNKLLLASLSRRAAETVQEKLAFLGHVKLRRGRRLAQFPHH